MKKLFSLGILQNVEGVRKADIISAESPRLRYYSRMKREKLGCPFFEYFKNKRNMK
jgi:hypothetical protein